MLRDLGHPFARGQPVHDVTFENVQAGERTSHLFRLANHRDAIVVGTGDLSELALGWCTYGVGDHMSHYNVNSSVPKTLISHLIRWVAQHEADEAERRVLEAIAETEISPELVRPRKATRTPSPRRRRGRDRSLSAAGLQPLPRAALGRDAVPRSRTCRGAPGTTRPGAPGPTLPEDQRRAYGIAEIKKHLRTFVWPLLQDQPVQALLPAQRAEDRLGRVAQPAWRLARAQRLRGDGVARRPGPRAGAGADG
jgi:NAD+ synthase (glutamine-hydrolysing)